MADPAAIMGMFTHMDQPDPFGMYTKAQNVLIQGQTLETNRRLLEGGKAAGVAIQAATRPDGSLDPGIGYAYIRDNVPPDQQAAAMQAFQAAETNAIANRTAAGKFAQDQIGRAGLYGGAWLASHTGPVSPEEASKLVAKLTETGWITETMSLSLQRSVQGAANDEDRRAAIGEWWLTALGPEGQARQIPVTRKDRDGNLVEGSISAVDILAGSRKLKFTKTPLPSPIATPTPATPAAAAAAGAAAAGASAPGSVPATGEEPAPGEPPAPVPVAQDDSGFAQTGATAAEVATAAGATPADLTHANAAIAQGYKSKREAGLISTLLTEAARFKSGPYVGDINRLKAAWNELFPGVPLDVGEVGTTEAFVKTATAIANQAGGEGTDMVHSLALASNLHAEISNVGINMIGHQLLGIKAMEVAEGLAAGKFAKNPVALRANNEGWMAHGDVRLFQAKLMSPHEKEQFLGARYVPAKERGPNGAHWAPVIDDVTGKQIPLTKDKLQNLNRYETDHQYAADNHWFDNIPSMKTKFTGAR